jgi:hypothetical protein
MIRTGKATAVVTLGMALVFAGRQLPAQNGGENALGRRIPNSTIPVLHTFLSGGAMLSNPATSGLGTGHGVWTHTGGDTFKNTIRLFAFAPSGAFAGMATVARDIVLSPDGGSLTSDDVSEFRDPAGNLIGSRCAAVTGTRLD